MGLSSNSIIHFTKNITALKGILKDDFMIRYCQEFIQSKSNSRKILVPIVSFCDIPFSQIIQHINNYGCYGIGLSKKWAEEKGLNPVIYLDKNSIVCENILNELKNLLHDNTPDEIDKFTTSQRKTYDLFRYIKNYQGDLIRSGKLKQKDYRYSDEREWRYALNPEINQQMYGNINSFKASQIKRAKDLLNKDIEIERLNFKPNDINYIIIKKESERDAIIRLIEVTKGKYSHAEVKRLTSRIISTEQLKTDF